MRIIGLSLVLAGALLATDYSYEISPMIGGVIAEGNANIDNQAAIGLRFQMNDWNFLGFVPEVSYDFSPNTDYSDSGDTTINRLALNALYEFKDVSETLTPYLLAGIGYEHSSNENHGFLDSQNYASSMYGNYGGGIKWKIMDDIAFRAEVKGLLRADDGVDELYYGIGLSIPFGEKAAEMVSEPEEVVVEQETKVEEVKEVDHEVEVATATAVTAAVVVVDKDKDKDGVLDEVDSCLDSKAGAEVDEKGCEKIFVLNVKFEYDSADIDYAFNSTNISKTGEEELEGYAGFMNKHPEYKVTIIGHTDNKGSDAYNQKLSQKRAENVKNELIKRGVDSSRIKAIGEGETHPIATNETKEGRAQNRRIEAHLELIQ